MTRDEIIRDIGHIGRVLEDKGVALRRVNGRFMAKCPFHEDKSPSFSVDVDKGLWNCFAGCGSGSVIDLVARFDGVTPADVLRRYQDRPDSPSRNGEGHSKTEPTSPRGDIVALYSYRDALGREAYQVARLNPKSFRQRHTKDGKWVWNMEGVERVLYRLPEVRTSETVWIVEGEKDADNLATLGFCSTCNVGGAGKWLAAYSESLAEKHIVLCGDNDKPGQEHIELVQESVSGKVKTTRQVKVPKTFKDVSDYIASFGESDDDARAALTELYMAAQVFTRGVHIPIFSIAELEPAYLAHAQNLNQTQFNLSAWLPALGSHVRGLVPGELVTIIADTGVGKTALLQNIAAHSHPLVTLFFELELPPEMMFERFVSLHSGVPGHEVERSYREGMTAGGEVLSSLPNLYVCTEARMKAPQMEEYINRAELKIGERPRVVLADYLQLMEGEGRTRYERMSNLAEDLKRVAKSTRTIMFAASQIHRKPDDKPEIFLHDAKDSGSIENSSGLMLGCWREDGLLKIKILKNTKGRSGAIIDCRFNGASMRITQAPPIHQEDVPHTQPQMFTVVPPED